MALIAPLAGALSDRLHASRVAAWGVAIAFASALFAVTLDEASSRPAARRGDARGAGHRICLFLVANMAIFMNAVPAERHSIASALAAQARSLGMLAGMLTTAFSILAALSLWALGLGWRSARRAAQRDTQ